MASTPIRLQVARASDFGRNDERTVLRSHLGGHGTYGYMNTRINCQFSMVILWQLYHVISQYSIYSIYIYIIQVLY